MPQLVKARAASLQKSGSVKNPEPGNEVMPTQTTQASAETWLKTKIQEPAVDPTYPNMRLPVKARAGMTQWSSSSVLKSAQKRPAADSLPASTEDQSAPVEDTTKPAEDRAKPRKQPHLLFSIMSLVGVRTGAAKGGHKKNRFGLSEGFYSHLKAANASEAKFHLYDEKVLRRPPKTDFKNKSLKLGDITPYASSSSSEEDSPDDKDHADERNERVQAGREQALASAQAITSLGLNVPPPAFSAPSAHGQTSRILLPDPDDTDAIAQPNSIRLQELLLAAQEEQAEWYDYDPNSNVWATKSATIRKTSLEKNAGPTHVSVRELESSRWVSKMQHSSPFLNPSHPFVSAHPLLAAQKLHDGRGGEHRNHSHLRT